MVSVKSAHRFDDGITDIRGGNALHPGPQWLWQTFVPPDLGSIIPDVLARRHEA